MGLSFEDSLRLAEESQRCSAARQTAAMFVTPPLVDWKLKEGYDFYADYSDDKISTVDGDKNIVINSNQSNLTQESNSQFIPFEMPRYYDGFDLLTTKITIHFVNEIGGEGRSNAVNVYYNDTSIRFAWLVNKNATAIAGVLKFEIEARGINSKGDPYCWKSRPSESLDVERSLSGNGMIKPDDSWINGFFDLVSQETAKSQAYAQEAKSYSDGIKQSADAAAQFAANAKIHADNANTANTQAQAFAANASASATQAGEFNNQALDCKNQAATKADAAALSAQEAKTHADSAKQSVAGIGQHVANAEEAARRAEAAKTQVATESAKVTSTVQEVKKFAADAKLSADDAKLSSDNAAKSASDSALSAAKAENASAHLANLKQEVAASAQQSIASADAARLSAEAAAKSASGITVSLDAMKGYADAAKLSETNAASAADRAAASERQALSSIQQSAASAEAAKSSAANAAQSASAAETSNQQAGVSAQNAKKAADDLLGTDSTIKANEDARRQAEILREQNFNNLTTQSNAATTNANNAAKRAEDAVQDIKKQDFYGSGALIADRTDLNNVKSLGRYYSPNVHTTESLLNAPGLSEGFTMVVEGTGGSQSTGAVESCIQRVFGSDTAVGYNRTFSNGVWSSWKKMYLTDDKTPISVQEGGTGASTVKGAEYSILGGISDELGVGVTDVTKLVSKTENASADNGVLRTLSASALWEYVKAKADGIYANKSTLKIDTEKHILSDGYIARRNGNVVSISAQSTATFNDGTIPKLVGTLPVGWRPTEEQVAPIIMQDVPSTAYIKACADGNVYIDSSSTTYMPATVWIKCNITFIVD